MKNRQRLQSGAAIVEFALTISFFCLIVFAIIEFSRAMFVWNTAAEATRLASRLSAVCDLTDTQRAIIRNKVKKYVQASGQVTVPDSPNWLQFSYQGRCDPTDFTISTDPCLVQTYLSNLEVDLKIPLISIKIPLPSYHDREMREAMRSTYFGEVNSVCQ